ncbi:hypothetical protein PFISCL1PPCAC_1125, partial [Pristionchus fissidentatus]
ETIENGMTPHDERRLSPYESSLEMAYEDVRVRLDEAEDLQKRAQIEANAKYKTYEREMTRLRDLVSDLEKRLVEQSQTQTNTTNGTIPSIHPVSSEILNCLSAIRLFIRANIGSIKNEKFIDDLQKVVDSFLNLSVGRMNTPASVIDD